MALKVLDDAAQRILQDAVKLINQRPPYSPTRPPFNPDTPSLDTNSTPEVYVCRIPTGGLPGLSLADIGTSTSSLESLFQVDGIYCQVYQVDNKDGVLRQVPGNTPYVYNLSSSSIPEDIWVIVVKDNYGDWYAIASVVDTSIGTGTGTHEHIGGTPCDFAYLDSYDCIRINTTDPHGNSVDTYLKYDSGHWTSPDVFNYIGGSGTFDFYYEAGRFHLKLDSKELLDCGTGCFTGAWITGHWTLAHATGTGTPQNVTCSGPTFTICIECSCCPIDNWQGPGYYCIVDMGFTGTGTDSSDCEPVILEDKDKCNTNIVICSGRYTTQEEVLAACDNVTGTGSGIILVPSTCFGSITEVPNNFTITLSGVTNTGFCSECTNLNITHIIGPYNNGTCKWASLGPVVCTFPSATGWQLDIIGGLTTIRLILTAGALSWQWTATAIGWDYISPRVLSLTSSPPPPNLCDNIPVTITITPG